MRQEPGRTRRTILGKKISFWEMRCKGRSREIQEISKKGGNPFNFF